LVEFFLVFSQETVGTQGEYILNYLARPHLAAVVDDVDIICLQIGASFTGSTAVRRRLNLQLTRSERGSHVLLETLAGWPEEKVLLRMAITVWGRHAARKNSAVVPRLSSNGEHDKPTSLQKYGNEFFKGGPLNPL